MNKQTTLNNLEKLHQLSMEMEDLVSDISRESEIDVDVNEIQSNIKQTTADIQDLIDQNRSDEDDDIDPLIYITPACHFLQHDKCQKADCKCICHK